MNIRDSVVSPDGALKATLAAFDSKSGQGRLKIEELKAERGRFYVTVTYGEAGQTRIDYKTYDLKEGGGIAGIPPASEHVRMVRRSHPSAPLRAGSVKLPRVGAAFVVEAYGWARPTQSIRVRLPCSRSGRRPVNIRK